MKKTNLLDKEIVDILEYRIQQEEFSSRLYEQLSLWLNDNGYLNTSELYKIYSTEELKHAGWSKSYLLDYGLTPSLRALDAPVIEVENLKDVFEATLEHELLITKQCEELANKALEKKNHVLYTLAGQYCKEQQEEIGKAITNLDILALSNDMLLVDHYIGEKLL